MAMIVTPESLKELKKIHEKLSEANLALANAPYEHQAGKLDMAGWKARITRLTETERKAQEWHDRHAQSV